MSMDAVKIITAQNGYIVDTKVGGAQRYDELGDVYVFSNLDEVHEFLIMRLKLPPEEAMRHQGGPWVAPPLPSEKPKKMDQDVWEYWRNAVMCTAPGAVIEIPSGRNPFDFINIAQAQISRFSSGGDE